MKRQACDVWRVALADPLGSSRSKPHAPRPTLSGCTPRAPRSTTIACLALILIAGQAPGQESRVPIFDLVTNTGVVATGSLQEIGADWSMTVVDSPSAGSVAGKSVVSLRRVQFPLPPWPKGPHVVLVNGDRLVGRPLRLKNERLEFECSFKDVFQEASGQVVSLPLDQLALLWWALPEKEKDPEQLERRLLAQRRGKDFLWLRNGDRIEGNLTELTQDVVRLEEAGGRQSSVGVDKSAVVALNTELARQLRPRGLFGRLILTDGTRLSLVGATADSRILSGKTLQGKTVSLSVNQIASIDMFNGCAVYLSDLKPTHFEHNSFLGVRWPLGSDASVAGAGIRLGGSSYDKGLGMHSESRVQFDLDGSYEWFEALAGLDERTGRKGSVEIEVQVDGKPQEIGKTEFTGQDPPRPIRIRVAGGRTLTLVVKFGRGGDVQDHFDWAEARLLKPVP